MRARSSAPRWSTTRKSTRQRRRCCAKVACSAAAWAQRPLRLRLLPAHPAHRRARRPLHRPTARRGAPSPPRDNGQDTPMPEEIVMPRLSDTMQEGTIARWLKREGDAIKTGEPLMEVETDKATMELNSYHDGTLAKILLDDGGSAPVGTVVGLMAKPGEDPQQVAAADGAASADGAARQPQAREAPQAQTAPPAAQAAQPQAQPAAQPAQPP